jgi:hypothetical protein
MTRAIRYKNPRWPDVAGLVITRKEEAVAERARLEKAGYVVIEVTPVKPGKNKSASADQHPGNGSA